jgi:hypothetical protein
MSRPRSDVLESDTFSQSICVSAVPWMRQQQRQSDWCVSEFHNKSTGCPGPVWSWFKYFPVLSITHLHLRPPTCGSWWRVCRGLERNSPEPVQVVAEMARFWWWYFWLTVARDDIADLSIFDWQRGDQKQIRLRPSICKLARVPQGICKRKDKMTTRRVMWSGS